MPTMIWLAESSKVDFPVLSKEMYIFTFLNAFLFHPFFSSASGHLSDMSGPWTFAGLISQPWIWMDHVITLYYILLRSIYSSDVIMMDQCDGLWILNTIKVSPNNCWKRTRLQIDPGIIAIKDVLLSLLHKSSYIKQLSCWKGLERKY